MAHMEKIEFPDFVQIKIPSILGKALEVRNGKTRKPITGIRNINISAALDDVVTAEMTMYVEKVDIDSALPKYFVVWHEDGIEQRKEIKEIVFMDGSTLP